jgi:hypothetical protein
MLKVKRLEAGSYEVPGTGYFFYRADLYGAEVSEDGISNRGLWYIYRVVVDGAGLDMSEWSYMGWHDQFVDAAGSYKAAKAVVLRELNKKG